MILESHSVYAVGNTCIMAHGKMTIQYVLNVKVIHSSRPLIANVLSYFRINFWIKYFYWCHKDKFNGIAGNAPGGEMMTPSTTTFFNSTSMDSPITPNGIIPTNSIDKGISKPEITPPRWYINKTTSSKAPKLHDNCNYMRS